MNLEMYLSLRSELGLSMMVVHGLIGLLVIFFCGSKFCWRHAVAIPACLITAVALGLVNVRGAPVLGVEAAIYLLLALTLSGMSVNPEKHAVATKKTD